MGESEDFWVPDHVEDPGPHFEDLTWETRDGKVILICHMDDGHLLNTVRMLRKNDMTVPYQMEMEIAHRKLKEARWK